MFPWWLHTAYRSYRKSLGLRPSPYGRLHGDQCEGKLQLLWLLFTTWGAMSIPISGNLTMFCIFTLRSPSWNEERV